jgi:hypothetical protein
VEVDDVLGYVSTLHVFCQIRAPNHSCVFFLGLNLCCYVFSCIHYLFCVLSCVYEIECNFQSSLFVLTVSAI